MSQFLCEIIFTKCVKWYQSDFTSPCFFFLFIHRITLSYSDTHILDLANRHSPFTCIITSDYLIPLNSQKSTAPNREEVTMPKESNLGWSDFQSVYFMVMKGIMLLLYLVFWFMVFPRPGVPGMTSWSKIPVSCSLGLAMKSRGWSSHTR